MKHGPIALIDENMPVVVVAPRDAVHGKIVSNIQEVRARGGKVIAIVNKDDEEISRLAEATFIVPGDARPADADPDGDSAAAAVVLRGGQSRLQRGSAAQPGEERDGRIGESDRERGESQSVDHLLSSYRLLPIACLLSSIDLLKAAAPNPARFLSARSPAARILPATPRS